LFIHDFTASQDSFESALLAESAPFTRTRAQGASCRRARLGAVPTNTEYRKGEEN
jgi:hypothetical protein